MASSSRITPGDRKELGLIGWTVGQVVRRATKTTSANLFTTMGRNRKLSGRGCTSVAGCCAAAPFRLARPSW